MRYKSGGGAAPNRAYFIKEQSWVVLMPADQRIAGRQVRPINQSDLALVDASCCSRPGKSLFVTALPTPNKHICPARAGVSCLYLPQTVSLYNSNLAAKRFISKPPLLA